MNILHVLVHIRQVIFLRVYVIKVSYNPELLKK